MGEWVYQPTLSQTYLIFLNPIISCQSPVTWELTPHWRKELFILFSLLLEVLYLDNSDHGTQHKAAHMQAHNNPTHDSSQTLPTAKSYQSSVRPSPTGQLIPPLWWQWLQAEPVPALQCFQWETQQFALLTGSESDIHTLLLTTFVKGLEILTQGLEAVTFKHSRARFAEFLYWSHENALKFCNVFPHISVKCLRTFHKNLGSMWGWEEVGSFRTWKNDLMWPETSQIFIYWNKSRKKRHRNRIRS